MIELPHSDHAMAFFFVLSALLTFLGTWTWLTWAYIRNMRGLLMATQLTALAIITACHGIVQAELPAVDPAYVVMVSRIAWVFVGMSALLQVDLYLADHNNHRALTTRAYHWYCKQVGRTA